MSRKPTVAELNGVESLKANLGVAELVSHALPALADGDVLARIERFARSTNNVSCAAFDDSLGYWNLFASKPAGCGCMPVWSHAAVANMCWRTSGCAWPNTQAWPTRPGSSPICTAAPPTRRPAMCSSWPDSTAKRFPKPTAPLGCAEAASMVTGRFVGRLAAVKRPPAAAVAR